MEASDTMIRCGYCGLKNDATSLVCGGCGNDLQPKQITRVVKEKRLDARAASIIFFSYLGFQLLAGSAVGMFAVRKDDLNATLEAAKALTPLATILGLAFGFVGMVAVSISLIPQFLKDAEPTGAAWVFGNLSMVLKGFFFGSALAFCYLATSKFLYHHKVPVNDFGPLGKMAFSSVFGRVIWAICALFLAPPSEELLFRGVMYGGYRKSFGHVVAAVLTTVLFVLLHLTEAIHFPVAIVSITLMASFALWLRIHYRSIGPAVAFHMGYNATIVLMVFAVLGLK